MQGERPVVPQPYHHSSLQCELWLWEVPEEGVHQVCHPEVSHQL